MLPCWASCLILWALFMHSTLVSSSSLHAKSSLFCVACELFLFLQFGKDAASVAVFPSSFKSSSCDFLLSSNINYFPLVRDSSDLMTFFMHQQYQIKDLMCITCITILVSCYLALQNLYILHLFSRICITCITIYSCYLTLF